MGHVLRVLIVEDDAGSRRLLQVSFSLEGHEVDVAADGASAIDAVAANSPDAIVVDGILPDIDGIELVRRFRTYEAMSSIPIVLLTGRDDETHIAEGMAAGASAYLVKPFDPSALVQRVCDLAAAI